MLWHPLTDNTAQALAAAVAGCGRVYGPLAGPGAALQLRPIPHFDPCAIPAGLPQLPLKKLLLPPEEDLWICHDGRCTLSPAETAITVVSGVFSCDLHALACLDRIWAADRAYRARRKRLLVIGAQCVPGPECWCPPAEEIPPFDLFVAAGRIWSGSPRGTALLACLPGQGGDDDFREVMRTWGDGCRPPLPAALAADFAASAAAPFWAETARRCLGCGLCSAVCPTCSCFDMRDTLAADGTARRTRLWDNCFFPEHGVVAGGHNFRPTRTERLRFRFEHKLLGFGTERGRATCVGCGRCTAACPVAIALPTLLRQVRESAAL